MLGFLGLANAGLRCIIMFVSILFCFYFCCVFLPELGTFSKDFPSSF
ncbi:hypothetical protein PORCRE_1589 [Porphyromonas crevioricanis JCM 15906]|uniref:Uncharacterized protein n=1 Tax=Porphyromonas crevioricanis JCM 15906 TaxID=1305617 RepID=T1DSV3_9PORP|nr:hypothetical protein PORCRE_1589 [Porphyromonas crevioricanis JCM 15906]GAD07970.1 hypothetical protein PORCAN_1600 [Porphyromonas crevioricanis JCM 13913]